MAIYTRNGEEYLVTKDWLGRDLHIPMNIVADAIVRAADEGSDANQIEAYIQDTMLMRGLTNAEGAALPSAEEIALENVESGDPLTLVINDETYYFITAPLKTLTDLAVWISESLNQAMERVTAPYVTQLKKDLEKAGFSQGDITLTVIAPTT